MTKLNSPTSDMGLHAGTRLGPYEIVAQIGAGGMGEVYRARDHAARTATSRSRCCPTLVAHDPERLARFEREAKLLASLNHPHIAQIYGVEDSASMLALVMELVEGPTLAERIWQPVHCRSMKRCALRVRSPQASTQRTSKGSSTATSNPPTSRSRPTGRVKVLDFGLAKASARRRLAPRSHAIADTGSTRHGHRFSAPPAYMSPEQARGKPVDKRTDIWAFGCVLYEMLTGRLAFGSETVSDTIAAVLDASRSGARCRRQRRRVFGGCWRGASRKTSRAACATWATLSPSWTMQSQF